MKGELEKRAAAFDKDGDGKLSEQERKAMHDALEQFVAFPQDGVDNRAFLAKGKLAIPILAIGGDHSYGAAMVAEYQVVVTDVTKLIGNGLGPLPFSPQRASRN